MLAIFTDALHDLSIVPLGQQANFYATLSFQPDQALLAVLLASIGGTLGCLINYILGRFIGRHLNANPAKHPHLPKAKQVFAEYGWTLLLLSWLPLGNLLPLIAGGLGYKPKNTAILCAVSMVGFYLYQWLL